MTCFCLMATLCAIAQNKDSDHNWKLGLETGVGWTKTTGLGSTLVSDSTLRGYTWEQNHFRFTNHLINLFLNYHHQNLAWLRWQPEVGISLNMHHNYGVDTTFRKGDLEYNDIKGLKYKIYLDYDHVVLNLFSVKLDLNSIIRDAHDAAQDRFRGSIEVAFPVFGFNFNPKQLFYTSNTKNLTEDLYIQNALRELLVGQSNISGKFSASLQWEWDNIGICARYAFNLGVRDVLETRANGYGFAETRNVQYAHNVTIGVFAKFN